MTCVLSGHGQLSPHLAPPIPARWSCPLARVPTCRLCERWRAVPARPAAPREYIERRSSLFGATSLPLFSPPARQIMAAGIFVSACVLALGATGGFWLASR